MTTGTEITRPAGMLVDPWTGEARELATLSADELSAYVHRSVEVKAAIREADRQVAKELMRRKNAGSPVAGVDVTQRRTWHAGETIAALNKLDHDGKLPTSAEHYVREETAYKPVGKNLNALVDQLTASGDIEAAGVLLTARRQSFNTKVAS